MEPVMRTPATLAHAVQQTQEWLRQVCDYAELSDLDHAYSVLRAVLHQLRDRLTMPEAFDLAAQLPVIVRGLYFEAYRPRTEHPKVRSRQGFLDGVTARLQPHRVDPETAVRAVFATLAHRCDAGEISDVIAQLPSDIKTLWPVGSAHQSARARP
jgi:uncharacterized protein (DUF2267 family)